MNARWAEAGNNWHTGALRVIDEGLGRHTGDNLKANASSVRRALCHGLQIAVVVLTGAGGDVDLHVLECFDAQLRIMVDPILRVVRAPHVGGGESASIHLGCGDSLRHALRGGVQVAREGTNELEQVRVTLRQVHSRGTAHGDAGNGALLVGTVGLIENRDELLGQEGLPLVVAAIVRLLPVRVERGLAAHRHDEVDVAVSELSLDVGLNGPAGLVIACAQAVECPYLWELLIRAGVPVTSKLDLDNLLLVRHRCGLDVDAQVAVGQVFHAGNIDAFRKPLNLWVLGLNRSALRRGARSESIR